MGHLRWWSLFFFGALIVFFPFMGVAGNIENAKSAIRMRNYPLAVSILKPLAAKNDPDAEYMLAGLYRTGKGVKKDVGKAFKLLMRAAKKRYPRAWYGRYGRASMYERGVGSIPDLLFLCARRGDVVPARWALNQGTDVALRDESGRTSLMDASEGGHESVVKLLLAGGASPHKKDLFGDTPLLLAAASGNPRVISMLVRKGARLDDRDVHGNTPLHIASGKGNLAAVRILMRMGSPLNATNSKGMTAADLARSRGHGKVFEELLVGGGRLKMLKKRKNFSSPGGKEEFAKNLLRLRGKKAGKKGTYSYKGWTDLTIASWEGNLAAVKALVTGGVPVDGKNGKGFTPLLLASRKGNVPVVDYLLRHGADWELKSREGMTPLREAASRGYDDVVRLLLERAKKKGKSITQLDEALLLAVKNGHQKVGMRLLNSMDISQDSPLGGEILGWASRKGESVLLELLLDKGLPVNMSDKNGRTALWFSSNEGRVEVVSLLLRRGGDPNLRDLDGYTPLARAVIKGETKIVDLLLRAGARTDIRTNLGNTPLILAADRGRQRIVKRILKEDEGINRKNYVGNTALILAASKGDKELVRMLLAHGANPVTRNKRGESAISVALENSDMRKMLKAHETKGFLSTLFH